MKINNILQYGEHPVTALVQNVLLEEKGGTTRAQEMDNYMLRWSLANDFDLVFVVLYQKLIPLLYVDELLESMKQQFLKLFAPEIKAMNAVNYPLEFDGHFDKIHKKAMKSAKQQQVRQSPASHITRMQLPACNPSVTLV